MIKKTTVEQLRPGMFVSDFNAGWLGHPFLLNQMLLESEAQIAAIRKAGIREVYIDSERGIDAPDAPSAAESAAVTEQEIRHSIGSGKGAVDRVSMAEEYVRAKRIYTEATSMVRGIMNDVRLGHQIGLAAADEVVDKIVGSVLRNGSALMVVCRMRQQDDYTFRHSVNLSVMLANLAKTLGADITTLREISLGGLIHDVGKMRVDQEVLNKPGKLTDEEFRHMKSHVLMGAELARETASVPMKALAVLEEHHERFDGSGYPQGLQGDAISQAGKMAAICDVYDAITSDRCYHKGLNPAEAMRKIFEWSKYHFDPAVTHAFIRSIGIYPVGSLVRLESDCLGVVLEQRGNCLLSPVVRVFFDIKRNYHVPPREVDLSSRAGAAERIVGHEDPAKWNIEVSRFIS